LFLSFFFSSFDFKKNSFVIKSENEKGEREREEMKEEGEGEGEGGRKEGRRPK